MTSNGKTIDSFLRYVKATRAISTVDSFKYALSTFRKWLESTGFLIESLTPAQMTDYAVYLEAQNLKSSSRGHKMIAVRSMWRWLEKQGKTSFSVDLIPTIDTYDRESYPPVTPEEFQFIIDSMDSAFPRDVRDRAIISMLYATGVRRSELVSINVDDIDTAKCKGTVKTYKRKNHRRAIFWDQQTNDHLLDWIRVRDSIWKRFGSGLPDALFTSVSTNHRGNRLKPAAVSSIIRRIRKTLGIKRPLSPHSFRHAFGTRAMKNNLNPRYTQKMMGHAKLNTTMQYQHVEEKDLEEQYRKKMVVRED